MKVSLAHHWMFSMRGGEKVLEQFKLLFPESPIACLAVNRDHLVPCLKESVYTNSMLDRLGPLKRFYKQLLPLHPWLIRGIEVSPDTALCLSSDASMIKGVPLPEGSKHICYCHSPPRYLWDLQSEYTDGSKLSELVFRLCGSYLRAFDKQAAQRVDHFIANSYFVAKRIERNYGKQCDVVYPPVAVEEFEPTDSDDGYYLVVSQLTPYKKMELAVRACEEMKRRLVVIGTGEEFPRLQKIAGQYVTLRGKASWKEVKQAYQGCRAFLNPQVEDFGITAVEAQACGKPVIAYGEGGAIETVLDGQTGILFGEQTVAGMVSAIERFENGSHDLSPGSCRKNAERFAPARFREEIAEIVLRICPALEGSLMLEKPVSSASTNTEVTCST